MALLFGICFILYFLKLSVGHGCYCNVSLVFAVGRLTAVMLRDRIIGLIENFALLLLKNVPLF